MIRFTSILLLLYYSFGIFCLPEGDFAVIAELPTMYQHCKATEDKDMTSLDFITDHLINIDCFFDQHLNGDQQKPHTPMSYRTSFKPLVYISEPIHIAFKKPITYKKRIQLHTTDFYLYDFNSNILKPPIVS